MKRQLQYSSIQEMVNRTWDTRQRESPEYLVHHYLPAVPIDAKAKPTAHTKRQSDQLFGTVSERLDPRKMSDKRRVFHRLFHAAKQAMHSRDASDVRKTTMITMKQFVYLRSRAKEGDKREQDGAEAAITPEVQITGIVPEPNGGWMKQMARILTDGLNGFPAGCRYLIQDRSRLFTPEFEMILQSFGVENCRIEADAPFKSGGQQSPAE